MSYKINKTDGELVVELADGQIDTSTTDVTLIGKNYKGFGELFNENFIKILENFASTAPPSAPLTGQLWFDASQGRLKVYDGESFKANGPIVSNTQPIMVAGDIWIDNENNKLYFFDGTDLVLVGPEYTAGQGRTGFEVESVIDIANRERVILKIWVGGTLFGVIAKEEFRLAGTNKIPGYPDDPDDTALPPRQLFLKGFNLVDGDFWYQGTAAESRSLVDADGNAYSSVDFLLTDPPEDPDTKESFTATTGAIKIKNSNGLAVGIGDTEYARLKIDGTTTTLETQQGGTDIALKVRVSNQTKDAVYIDASEDRVGIYKNDPQYTLDVAGTFRSTGNAIIDGDLTVNGSATYFNVSKLTVEDKNIELGMLDDSTEGNDVNVDNAGIIVRSVEGSKDWTWENSTKSWTSNQDIDLVEDKVYKINGSPVLTYNALTTDIKTALGLNDIGQLGRLRVDYLRLDENSIITTQNDLSLEPANFVVNVNNSKITNVATPISALDVFIDPGLTESDPNDAATKEYVDNSTLKERIVFSLDITGLADPDNDVKAILEDMYPVTSEAEGKTAVIHCTSYASVTLSIAQSDLDSAIIRNPISVLEDDGVTAQTVVQSLTIKSVSGAATMAPTRTVRTYRVNSGGNWAQVGVTDTWP